MTPIARTIDYTYDGVQRLTGAVESPGSSFAYNYDLAGNRTGVTVDGTAVLTNTYDAADQVVGWTYDGAGNLTNDGTTSYGYDATNDLTGTTTTGQSRAYTYNGDGTLVGQTANGTTTNYTQDLAASQSQILAATTGVTTTDYLYGQDIAPLAALTGSTRTWYGVDGQGSVRQSLDDSGTILGVANYDPFGQIEAGSSLTGPFGYTGELQDPTTGQEYLRARWYQPGSGQLLGVDPALDQTGQPYNYADDDPVNGSDPSGNCVFSGGQLPGVDGDGSCLDAIEQALTGSSSTVGGSVKGNLAAFTTVLDSQLATAQIAALTGQSSLEAQVLNPGQCANPNACSSAAFDAAGAAGQAGDRLTSPGSVLATQSSGANLAVTGTYGGTFTGTSSRISIAVLVENGVVTVGTAVTAPGRGGLHWVGSSCGVTGFYSGVAVPAGEDAESAAALGALAVPVRIGQGLAGDSAAAGPWGWVVGAIAILAIEVGITLVTDSTSAPPPRSRLPIFYVYRSRTPVIWANDASAIASNLYPDFLHYDPSDVRATKRRRSVCNFKRKRELLVIDQLFTCDEYPFASTYEGGRIFGRPSQTVLAPHGQQQLQAQDIKAFYRDNGLGDRGEFLVQPIPWWPGT